MNTIRILFFILLSAFLSTCKKQYDWDVRYKVTIYPNTGQSSAPTPIKYMVKDNVSETTTITTTSWEYHFFGKEGDRAYIETTNMSNASLVIVEIMGSHVQKKDCNTANCTVSAGYTFE